MEKTFKTIKVKMELDVEISMHPSGRIRVHSCVNPNLNHIEGQLTAIPQADNPSDAKIQSQYMDILASIDGWNIVQKT